MGEGDLRKHFWESRRPCPQASGSAPGNTCVEECVGVSSHDDVHPLDSGGQLQIDREAGVTESDDLVDALTPQAVHFLLDAHDLVVKYHVPNIGFKREEKFREADLKLMSCNNHDKCSPPIKGFSRWCRLQLFLTSSVNFLTLTAGLFSH